MNSIEFYQDRLPAADAELVERIQQAADETPARDQGLAIHVKAIETLRAKGYSYRDIAGWFTDKGIKVNHVDVWRAHKNAMEEDALFDAAKYNPEWEGYYRKTQEGNGTVYEEKKFDDSGNEIPAQPKTISAPSSVPTAATSKANKKKGARRRK